MSELKAVHDKVILKQVEDSTKTIGGIIIPDTGKERSNFFEVVDVGPGMFNPHNGDRYPMEASIGDIVIIPKAVVTQIVVDGEEYYISREVEIQAILKN